MESLMKQIRIRFANTQQENKDESISTRDRKISPQKTQSFGEKRRSQSWIKRQFSSQMTLDNDSSVDYSTAVAAAAYAIHSLQESQTKDHRDKTSGTNQKLNKNKSKAEDSNNLPGPLKIALKSSDETSKKSFKDPDMKVPISTSTSTKILEKKPTHKKKLSFVDANETFSTQSENPAIDVQLERPSTFPDKKEDKNPRPQVSKPYRPPSPLPVPQVQPVQTRMQSVTKAAAPGNAIADAWEKEQMASIKERYEKLRATIDDWEIKKKRKAKRKLEKMEAVLDNRRPRAVQSYRSEMTRIEGIAGGARAQAEANRRNEEYKAVLDNRRPRAVQSYRSEMTRIEGIAGGARAQAEANRRNEEYKVRQKANKIRLTGKIPATCFCF